MGIHEPFVYHMTVAVSWMSRTETHKQQGIRLKTALFFASGDGRDLDRSVRIKCEKSHGFWSQVSKRLTKCGF
ncbi:hypothetical protein DKK68_08590 [Bifidobacterium asteroides]|nr:hypothetical protein DKK68_08590 [Bifidobacterium asteroides]